MTRLIWRWLRGRTLAGLKFRRQHPVGRYILDFYCPELKLGVELDGFVHDQPMRVDGDPRRDGQLACFGVAIVRMRNAFVRDEPESAWETIELAAARILAPRWGMTLDDAVRRLREPETLHPAQSPAKKLRR